MRLFQELGDRRGIAECLAGLAGLLGAVGRAEQAARLVGAAEVLLDAAGAHIHASNRSDYERDLAATRAQLGEELFESYRRDGRPMTQKGAIGYALEG